MLTFLFNVYKRFFIFVTFLRFLTFFYFSGNVFHLWLKQFNPTSTLDGSAETHVNVPDETSVRSLPKGHQIHVGYCDIRPIFR